MSEAPGDPADSRADRPAGRPRRRDDDGPVLPTVTRDEAGEGWGDEPPERDADWYRRERPPHHE